MSKLKTNDYANFLAILAKQAGNLSESDIQRVLSKELELKISVVALKKATSEKSTISEIDINNILNELSSISDRESATSLLNNLTKRNLDVIARKLDIAVKRSDKVDILKQKVVESTVGARLRSSAIQGTQT